MAQVQLDEVSNLDVQIANEHVLLGLGVDRTVREEGEIHQDHPHSPATLVLSGLAGMLYSLPFNYKFKFVIYFVDLAHAGSSAVQKMDLLKIVTFSPTARSIYIWPQAAVTRNLRASFPGLSTIQFLITSNQNRRLGNEARTVLYLQLC